MFENIWMDREPYQFRETPSVIIYFDQKLKLEDFNKSQNIFDYSFETLRKFFWEFLGTLKPTMNMLKVNFMIKVINAIIKMIHIQFIHETQHFKDLIRMIL